MPVWGWCCPLPSASVYLNNAHAFHRLITAGGLPAFTHHLALQAPSSPLLLSSLIMSAIAMTSSTTILAARPRATVSRYVAAELVVE